MLTIMLIFFAGLVLGVVLTIPVACFVFGVLRAEAVDILDACLTDRVIFPLSKIGRSSQA